MTRDSLDQSPNRPGDGPLGRLAATPFFGRAPLLSAVDAAFANTRRGRGNALLLLGEPGIGKTRMADEIGRLGQASGLRPVGARCHNMQGAPALWPWMQIVRQLCGGLEPEGVNSLLGDVNGPIRRLFPEFQSSPISSESHSPADVFRDSDDRYQLFENVTAILRRAAHDSPLLVVLDDLHWSDPASILLARYAVRELRRDPVFFVGLYRDTDVKSGERLDSALSDLTLEADVFRLEGLDPQEVNHFAEHVAGFEVPGVLAAALHAQTGGNPLFLVEVLRLLASEGRLGSPDAPTPGGIPLPLTVRHTLQRRLDALAADTRQVLDQAAVIGSEFDFEILEAALRSAELPSNILSSALDEAIDARLLRRVAGTAGRFYFAHDLIRETLDAGLSIENRARVHRRTADAIVATRSTTLEDHYATLAHHYLESASTGTAREAVDFATRGAARAAAAFSFELAVELFGHALRALDLLDAETGGTSESERTRVQILIDMGHTLWKSNQRSEARSTHQAAATLSQRLGDSALLAEAAIGLAGHNDVPMDFPDSSVQLMEEALDALPRDDSRLRVRLLAHLVRAKYFGDEREKLVDWAREAVAIATRMDDPGARFAALEALHYALLVPAHLEERLSVSSQLPELARKTGSIRFEALAWLWRAFDLLQVPDVAAADAAISQFEEAAHRLRQPFYEWLAAGLHATRVLMEGRLDEAERIVFRAFELGQRAGSPNALSFFGTQLFHLREAQGRSDELMPVMQKIVNESPALPVFRIGIPLIHALADRREDALRSFEQVAAHDFEDVPHDLHWLPMITSAAAVCAYLGDERRAEILLRSLRPEAGRIVIAGVATYWAGSVDRSLGQLEETVGRLDEAEGYFAGAAEAAARAGARLLEARALGDRARVLRQRNGRGDLAIVQEIGGQVAAIYRDLGIEPTDSMATSTTSATDAPPSPAPNRFLQRGRAWLLEYEGVRVELPDSKGLGYLQLLVSNPDEDVHVVDLISPEPVDNQSTRSDPRGADPAIQGIQRAESKIDVLDPMARRAYRERLRDLASQMDEAERDNDLARQTTLGEERDLIESELRKALGLSGRPRSFGDPTERARKSVYNRVRASIERITREHSSLGRHLRQSIRTGTTCSYRPDRPMVWHRD